MSSRSAVLASRNRHKARELEQLLPGWTIEPLDRDDYPPETGATYYENAALKARFGRAHAEGWVLAEDSGLEVEALGGRPGVLSARYAPEGAPAIAKLLGELGAPRSGARATSRSSSSCARRRRAPRHRHARRAGSRTSRRGSEGFGYDPIFIPEGEERTVAELGNDWKAEHSHRARAARALLHALADAPATTS